MASNLKYSASLKNLQMDALTTRIGASGELRLYSGAQPANPDTAVGAQVLLATCIMNATFAPAAAVGVLTLNAIANGTGTAGAGAGTVCTWFRMTVSGGATAHIDGTVGISACDLNINNTNIATGQTVSITGTNTFTNAN
jgi:hypothetical protein